MRHYNPTFSSGYPFYASHKLSKPITMPYSRQYINSYKKTKFRNTANSDRTYVKVLQFVADHDGCSRAEINVGLGYYKSVEAARTSGRGFNSCMYSQLLYIDVIDYDKSYRYHITEKGKEVLEFARLNDIKKNSKNK